MSAMLRECKSQLDAAGVEYTTANLLEMTRLVMAAFDQVAGV